MRRFIVGLICGLVLSGATVAVAAVSNEVRTILFPTSLHFYIDGKDSSSGNEEVSVLNYGNHLYIPLRVFAEKLGSTVNYRAPEPGGTMASVDILKTFDQSNRTRFPIFIQ